MGYSSRSVVPLLAFLLVLCLSVHGLSLEIGIGIGIGIGTRSCPKAESIVADEVRKALSNDIGIAAGLVRLHFHDCFVRGCDGSVLLDSTDASTAEKDSPLNNPSLRGFEVIDKAKARLEHQCPGVVSCADILAFAARDSIALTGGISYQVPSGRKDGTVSLASDTFSNLPATNSNVIQLTQSFADKGLTQDEMVTLSGAHTIGRSHCSSLTNRLFNFSSTVAQDPSLDPAYAALLKQQCLQGSNDTNATVPMDPCSPNALDNNYYANVLSNRGLFSSDQALISDPRTASAVKKNAASGLLWKQKFAVAMIKMGQIGVLTGNDGEIRQNCRVVN